VTYLLRNIVLIFSLFVFTSVIAQTKQDSALAGKYYDLFQQYEYVDAKLATKYIDSGIYFAKRTKSDELIGRGYLFRGWLSQDQSKFKEANKYFYKSLAYLKKAGDEQGVADAYGNLGNSYLDLHEYQKSLNYQLLALDANEKILEKNPEGDELEAASVGRTYALHNIGAIYAEIEMFEKALEYEWRSLRMEIDAENHEGVAVSYNTLGMMYKNLHHVDSAKYYFKKGIKLFESDKVHYPYAYANALQAYASLKNSGLSDETKIDMLDRSLNIRKEIGDIDGEVRTLLDIVEFEFDDLSTDSLSKLLEKSYDLLTEYELNDLSEQYFEQYAKYNSRIGQYDSAYFALQNYLDLRAISDEKRRTHDLIAGDIKHQLRTKHFNDSLQIENQFAEERAQHNEDIAEVQNIVYLSVIGFIILIVTLFIIINTNRRRRRMNEVLSEKNALIQEQKEIVEEKNASIGDSINYARRLQTAILPTREHVNQYFPNSFLFFRPKDVVSGDFYWFEVLKDECFMAVADCTGHGVPGAMVSVVCSNALNRSVNEFGLSRPNEILNKTREIVIETLGKSGEDVADGMDIALVAINRSKQRVVFAGAHNSLWLVRKKGDSNNLSDRLSIENDQYDLMEFKGDKQPVGLFEHMKDFTSTEFAFEEGDALYMTSDGYADQFGGERGKKFKYKPLKEELLQIQLMEMDTQKNQLERVFNEWIGDHEQIDDICFVGIKL
jgi:serine phosphatase RsbU (regulator of sigma subunit)/tetratricopeptide (TPR) repeat protein